MTAGGLCRAPAEDQRRIDEHLVAYRDHGPSLDPALLDAPFPLSEALAAHLVVRDGLVVGGWRRAVERRRVVVTTNLLVTLRAAERAALEAAADDYGRFMGMPIALEGD